MTTRPSPAANAGGDVGGGSAPGTVTREHGGRRRPGAAAAAARQRHGGDHRDGGRAPPHRGGAVVERTTSVRLVQRAIARSSRPSARSSSSSSASPAHLVARLVDRRQRDVVERGDERVVVADDRHVLGDPHAVLPRGGRSGRRPTGRWPRTPRSAARASRSRRSAAPHARRCSVKSPARTVARRVRGRLGHGLQVAGAARRGARARAAVDVHDPLVAELDEVRDGQVRAERLVGHHAVDARAADHAAADDDARQRARRRARAAAVGMRGQTRISPSVRYSSSASSVARSRCCAGRR